MLVDDEKALRHALRRVLEARGIQVVAEAGDGEEAVNLAQEVRPEAILMDLRMPILDGIEASRRIRELDPDAKIVILSAYSDPSLQEEARAAGVLGWLVKGDPPDEMCSRLLELTASGA